jgi:hypothetical protein
VLVKSLTWVVKARGIDAHRLGHRATNSRKEQGTCLRRCSDTAVDAGRLSAGHMKRAGALLSHMSTCTKSHNCQALCERAQQKHPKAASQPQGFRLLLR